MTTTANITPVAVISGLDFITNMMYIRFSIDI